MTSALPRAAQAICRVRQGDQRVQVALVVARRELAGTVDTLSQ